VSKFFPSINNPTKASTAMCATVFEELDSALNLLTAVRTELNPLQRQLAGRFIVACKVFGLEMLAADGRPDALRQAFGMSIDDPKADKASPLSSGRTLIDDVCTGVCADIERIGSSVQGELLTGVADVIAGIRTGQDPDLPERDSLDAMASSVRHLAHQVAALLRRHQLVYQAGLEADDAQADGPHMTAEAFMQSVKPPQRTPTLRDRLEPYIPQPKRLRQEGYTYAQCAQYLRENGISTYAAAISNALAEASR
jgi:hypothetical protein